MLAGKLRHRIIIQIASDTQDSSGQLVTTWNTKATVWASIISKTGTNIQLQQIATLGPTSTHEIVMRYPGFDIDKKSMQISFNNRIFTINDVNNDRELNKQMTLQVTEYLR